MFYVLNADILPQVRLINSAAIEPPYIHRKRRADEYILYIVKKGNMYLKENSASYELKEGDVFLLDPDYVHMGTRESSCEYYYIHFRFSGMGRQKSLEQPLLMDRFLQIRGDALRSDSCSYDSCKKTGMIFPKWHNISEQNSFLKVCRLLQEAIEQHENHLEYYKASCACRVLEVMIEIERSYISSEVMKMSFGVRPSLKKVHEVLNYLNSNYHETISGESIEEMFACNFDYLNRMFKKNMGKTIFAYLNEIRIHHAKELIATTSMKISVVGYRVGFHDECYFSKVFKKYAGISPSGYSRLMMKEDAGGEGRFEIPKFP